MLSTNGGSMSDFIVLRKYLFPVNGYSSLSEYFLTFKVKFSSGKAGVISFSKNHKCAFRIESGIVIIDKEWLDFY